MVSCMGRTLSGASATRGLVTRGLCVAATLFFLPPAARAYLGSFTSQDGYALPYSNVARDVTYYNAGAYGANAGGGSGPTDIAADSGLWSLVSPVGAYFSKPADRTTYLSSGTPYAASDPNAVGVYLIGNHFPGRTGDQANLAFLNTLASGTGPAVYEYALDSFDFGGVSPASVTSGTLDIQFYFCPNPGDAPDPSGANGDKFTLSFQDSASSIGFEWGYLRDNSVVWRTSPSNPWNATAFVADQTNWDGLKIGLDLTNDTFAMDYFDVSASTWTNFVPAGTPLGQAMTNLTGLRWQLEDNIIVGNYAGKNFFDDFSFGAPVPEPAGATLAALAALGVFACARRK
ncbi:hypothetical protein Pla175_11110 [Pirellulimonas nuda]|uniref:PEP-CTERM protein-sorting domain-containing protein n=1 Tax=Pirellulimonas nuda TaxID=2528009 RepID=A0A518D8F3_9BACT|nr:hypothetical protein [Pirellulimonas nuda]QDU87745.1 hypothetical protein Pla175_11110 [Pirellulimonas nuda]